MDAVFRFFEELLTKFSAKRLGVFLVLLGFVALGLLAYESYTAAFRLARMEKTARILEALVELESEDALQRDPLFAGVHARLSEQLSSLTRVSEGNQRFPSVILKLLAASFPWLLVILPFLVQRIRGDEGAGTTALGAIALAIPFVVVGGLIPLTTCSWINYWVYPWGSFLATILLLLVLTKTIGKKDAPKRAQG
jgi:TRAP-type C4-dicarboxylate transport system permease small subunit